MAVMISTFFANTNTKIRGLKEDKSYPVIPKSGLNVIKKGNSRYFEERIRFPFTKTGKKISVPIGVFEKDLLVNEAIEKWYSIKLWSKENNKNPKLFGKEEKEKVSDKTFK